MSDLPDERQISRALERSGLRYVQDLNPDVAAQLSHWLNLLLSSPHNLTGIRDPEAAIDRHIIEPLLGRHRLIAADLPVPHGPLIDIGSGNGAPGLPFALCEPGRTAVLLDSRSGSTSFLGAVVERIGAPWITVVNERAERAAHTDLRESFALALTRAAAPPEIAIELAVPFLRVGGVAMLWTGMLEADARDRLDHAAGLLGAGPSPLDAPLDIQVFTNTSATEPRFPRSWNQIRRRPLSETDH